MSLRQQLAVVFSGWLSCALSAYKLQRTKTSSTSSSTTKYDYTTQYNAIQLNHDALFRLIFHLQYTKTALFY